MDATQFRTLARAGKPATIGHLGTVTVTPLPDGTYWVDFTLRKKGARRLLDGPKRKRHNTGGTKN